MFHSIRLRLVAWTVLVVALILTLLGAAVYGTTATSLRDQVDRNLDSRADQAAENFTAMLAGTRANDREGYLGGVFYLVLGFDGRVLANPQQVNVASVRLPSGPLPPRWYGTVTMAGESIRVYARPLNAQNTVILMVGQSLEPEERALHTLLLILLAGGGIGLLLSFAGAWFLAGRALIPIQRAFRRQQEFVADASHELRTPLTVIHSATDLLNEHRSEPLAANGELFDDIRQEIVRLERLSGDLLTLARSDRGELDLATAPVGVDMLAADVVRRVEPLAHQRGIALGLEGAAFRQHRFPLAPDAEDVQHEALLVEADPDRIQQVLLILIDNALKHTLAGGSVTVGVRQEQNEAVLEVADTGSGIPPEHIPRIFDRFYRSDAARNRDQGGAGLGLAIARAIVQAHGGTIGLISTLGVGTRVTIRLPLLSATPTLTQRLGGLAARIGVH